MVRKYVYKMAVASIFPRKIIFPFSHCELGFTTLSSTRSTSNNTHDMSRRHPPPSYEEDRAASPDYVCDDGDEPDYDNENYLTEDPNPGFADEERQETDEDMARARQ